MFDTETAALSLSLSLLLFFALRECAECPCVRVCVCVRAQDEDASNKAFPAAIKHCEREGAMLAPLVQARHNTHGSRERAKRHRKFVRVCVIYIMLPLLCRYSVAALLLRCRCRRIAAIMAGQSADCDCARNSPA